ADVAGEARPLGAGADPRHAAPAATSERARARGKGRVKRDVARTHGAASQESKLRKLSRPYGSDGFCLRELQRPGQISPEGWRFRDRSFGNFAGRTDFQGAQGVKTDIAGEKRTFQSSLD